MPISIGSEPIQGLYLGSTAVSKVYLGDTLVYGGGSSNNSGIISISGSYRVGTSLYANVTDLDGVGVAEYKWERSINGISWATIQESLSNQYAIVEDDRGYQIRVTATYIDDLSNNESPVSGDVYIPYGQVDINLEYPVLVGDILVASMTTPNGLVGSVSYQWSTISFDDGSYIPISGATTSSYTVTEDDIYQLIIVIATFTDDDGRTETTYSQVGNPIPLTTGGSLTITGILQAGETLEVGVSDPDGTTMPINYDWQRSNDGTVWQSDFYTTFSNFVLPSDAGGYIYRVIVSYNDGSDNFETLVALTDTIDP